MFYRQRISFIILGFIVGLGFACGNEESGVPYISYVCKSTSASRCDVGNHGKDLYYGFHDGTCASIRPGDFDIEAIGVSTAQCSAGVCQGSFNGPWVDASADPVSQVTPGTYAVYVFMDVDDNYSSDGPRSGDMVCCSNLTINSDSAGVVLATAACSNL